MTTLPLAHDQNRGDRVFGNAHPPCLTAFAAFARVSLVITRIRYRCPLGVARGGRRLAWRASPGSSAKSAPSRAGGWQSYVARRGAKRASPRSQARDDRLTPSSRSPMRSHAPRETAPVHRQAYFYLGEAPSHAKEISLHSLHALPPRVRCGPWPPLPSRTVTLAPSPSEITSSTSRWQASEMRRRCRYSTFEQGLSRAFSKAECWVAGWLSRSREAFPCPRKRASDGRVWGRARRQADSWR